jgi:serine phosphatase RsbU (regulator of sigma subunit)/GAF domain-containing protein
MAEQTELDIRSIASILTAISHSAADPNEIAEVAFLEIARLIELDVFELGIFEANSYRTLIRVVEGSREPNLQIDGIGPQTDLLTWVRNSGQAILFSDTQTELDVLPAETILTADQMPRSGLIVPLQFGDRVLGTISLHSEKTDAFRDEDRELLTIVAAAMAPALATVGLAGEIEFLTLQMLLLQQVSRLLMTLEPLSDRMDRVVTLIAQVLEIGEISLYELVDDEIELRAITSLRNQERVPREVPEIINQAIASGEIQSNVEILDTDGQEAVEEIAHFAFPLRIVHRRLGALHLCCPSGKKFDEEQVRVLETVTQHLAFAILEARNYAQQQQEAWITTVLLEVARHAAQPGDPLSALQAVLQLATLLVGTEWTILLTHAAENGLMQYATSAGLRRQQSFALSEMEISLDDIGLERPYHESDDPVILDIPAPMNDILEDDRAMCLVLSDGQEMLGLLLIENENLTGKQPSLMAGIAHQISLRLENSRLIEKAAARRSLERELAMAREIQVSFLPSSIPIVPEWEIGITWRVAREVGGDFYDFIPLPDGEHGERYGIVIADVADKGIPAALFMALSRTLLRTLAMEILDPGACLERVNQQLIQDTQADLFVSVFYAIWEPETGILEYANAGHNPPLLFTPRQRGELLRDHGMVLGVRSTSRYQTHTLKIGKGQMLVLYTDGITDALDENDDFFGIQRLESLVLGLPDWRAQQVAERIEERVLQFTGQRDLFDDLTAIILHR